ncbi:MAG TPA: DUF4375 domain-containing protein [Candidatus Solibacter sp.]
MPTLMVDIPEVMVRRLEALATASGRSAEELAREGIDSLTASFQSRRAILKSRKDAAKSAGTNYSLADLGWIDGYAGQTLDELLLFDGTESGISILFAVEEAIQQKGPKGRTGVERIVLSVLALNREVGNGGYEQFFANSSRQFAPAIVDDLVRIGCVEIADITQRVLDAFHLAEISVSAIEAAMQTESQERTRALNRCDIAFYATRGVHEHLLTYVKAHKDAIRV